MSAPMVVAEIGGNHRGDLHTALRMIEVVGRYCTEHFQLDGSRPDVAVKFQKREPRLKPEDFQRPHPNPYFAYGETYGDHREALEFDGMEHAQLQAKCEDVGVTYSSSVWDIPSAEVIASLDPAWIKVPSAHNTDGPLIGWLSDWGGDLHISLGMTTRREADHLVDRLVKTGAASRTTLYHCTSAYPAPAEDVRLDEIDRLWDRYGSWVAGIAFSGHHHGIALDMAAAAKGVTHIERHFTLDRTWRGTDHAASLEPDGLRKLIRDVGAVHAARGDKGKTGLLEVEAYQRDKLKHVTKEAA